MAEPVRIAQVINRMDSGGIEAVVMNYYRHIDHSRVQFDFYFAGDSTFPQREELQRLGAGIYPVPAYTKVVAYQRELMQAFRTRGYRVVHTQLSAMSVFPLFAAWRAGVPVRICHNHSTAHWGEGKKTLLKYLLRPFCGLFATHRYACSEKAGRWMYGGRSFDAGRVTVMPNAIDTPRFAFDADTGAQVRAELSIPQQAFVLGHVGRFTYAKNHAFLLEVFARLIKQRPDAVLLLVGEGELETQVREKAAALGLTGSVVFAGVRQDVHRMYSAMDAFCMPSFYEGMGIVAWEAQANGLPCLLSDTVPAEACCSSGCFFLSLKAGAQAWCDALPQKRDPNMTAAVPDIRRCAEELQKFYLENT